MSSLKRRGIDPPRHHVSHSNSGVATVTLPPCVILSLARSLAGESGVLGRSTGTRRLLRRRRGRKARGNPGVEKKFPCLRLRREERGKKKISRFVASKRREYFGPFVGKVMSRCVFFRSPKRRERGEEKNKKKFLHCGQVKKKSSQTGMRGRRQRAPFLDLQALHVQDFRQVLCNRKTSL